MLLTAEQIPICTPLIPKYVGNAIFPLYLAWSFLSLLYLWGNNISFPLQIFPNIWQRNKRNKHIKLYNLGVVVFLMETAKLQGQPVSLNLQLKCGHDLLPPLLFCYTTFLCSTWIHLATLFVWRSKESSHTKKLHFDYWDGKTGSN